jgi:hypothetical protein
MTVSTNMGTPFTSGDSRPGEDWTDTLKRLISEHTGDDVERSILGPSSIQVAGVPNCFTLIPKLEVEGHFVCEVLVKVEPPQELTLPYRI